MQEATLGALRTVELYVGVPTGAVPQAGAVAVAVAAQTGQAAQVRLEVSVAATLTYWPTVQVVARVQMPAVVLVE